MFSARCVTLPLQQQFLVSPGPAVARARLVSALAPENFAEATIVLPPAPAPSQPSTCDCGCEESASLASHLNPTILFVIFSSHFLNNLVQLLII